MSERELGLPEEIRQEYENSEIPLAVYQLIDGRVRAILVSNGLIHWQAPDLTRKDLIHLLDTNMYRDVHREDLAFVATKAAEFSKMKDGHYDEVYRQKLYGKEEYRTIHASGYHRHLDNGTKIAVIYYDDVTAALESNGNDRRGFENSIIEFLNMDKVDPFVIFDAATHEIYMVSTTIEKLWKPVRPFDSGIKLEDYFFSEMELAQIPLDEIFEKGELIIRSPRTGKDLIVSVSQIPWHSKKAIFLRISEHADRYFDSLTGLPNQEYGRVCSGHYEEDIVKMGGTPAIIFFDIVGMKLFNSANGFNQGNEFLINFAACLKKHFPNNLVCRLSNDHFAVIANLYNIEETLQEIRKCVKSAISKISMDLFVGICKVEEFNDFIETSEKAKLACIIQKKKGDNFIRYYDEELNKDLLLQNYVVNHIDDAIANDYIKVYYQPVVRTITGTFCGMEALARWIDPQYGFLSPAIFIRALEESRQIHKLDSHIIELVCKELRAELDQGNSIVPVSFNLSRLDFIGCDIFEEVEKSREKHRIDREYIHVEITESIMASDPYVQKEIERFRQAGYEVWMDDFGSGYSSLNTLKDYKFDELKIDMAFLSNFNDVSRIIISSTVRMAKNLGLKTLAEGVETKEQMEFLKSIGCEKVQGYYYGKPQPLKDTLKHMESTGIIKEDRNMGLVYSKVGSQDYQVDSPKAIMSYKDGIFRFLFVNNQYKEQLQSLGFTSLEEVEAAANNPKNPVYYTLHEAEGSAYKAPREITYVTRGKYVFMRGALIADINGYHIYDLMLRNTNVSASDKSSSNTNGTIPTEKKTILLADGNPQNRAFLESLLRINYNLLLAEDGEQAIELLNEHENNISLALIEADLPKLDGFKIIQKFQENRQDAQIPFIIMTDNLDLAKESIRLGAQQFIHLPIKDKDMIKAKIDGTIKNAEALRQMALNYMEYIPGGVILIKPKDGKILYMNAKALDIFDCDNINDFQNFVGKHFKNLIIPEDYERTISTLKKHISSNSNKTKQISCRTKTNNGKIKRIYLVGRVFKKTPYGTILSGFISEDDIAMKNYFTRKDAFEKFMASGEATHTKSYDPGYKGFLIWNITKNTPAIRMDGISYIPKEWDVKYAYDTHYSYLSSLMMKSEENLLRAMDYTRERLILDHLNKCIVPPLDITYDVNGYRFTIRATFDMMMDPDTGDIILKLQNNCISTTKER